jgi:hypothetical protein
LPFKTSPPCTPSSQWPDLNRETWCRRWHTQTWTCIRLLTS